MTTCQSSRAASILRAAAPLVIAAFAIAILLHFPPAQYSFYPQCPVYRYLHIQCPGCGATRAFAALLHGNVVEAFRLNALTTLLVPPAAIYAIFCYRRFLRGETFSSLRPPFSAIYGTLLVAVVFAIVRNLVPI
ncbi:MAG: DUF2752 domain-containing protein [Edaphobacter sp.]